MAEAVMAEAVMAAPERVALTAHDGHALTGYRFLPASAPRASVVFGPAMAVPQAFYAPFAAFLARQGYAVWTFDYRGTGESLKGSMRGVKADLSDWLKLDTTPCCMLPGPVVRRSIWSATAWVGR